MPSDVTEKMKALERENRELCQANEILRKTSAYFAMPELDRPFKRKSRSLTNTVPCSGSGRSAGYCRCPVNLSRECRQAPGRRSPADPRPKRHHTEDRDTLRLRTELPRLWRSPRIWRQLKREARCRPLHCHSAYEIDVARRDHLGESRSVRHSRTRRLKPTLPGESPVQSPSTKQAVGFGFHYIATWQGFVYVGLLSDVFARRTVGWRASRTANASFVLDAVEQALHDRRPVHARRPRAPSGQGRPICVNALLPTVGSKAGVEPLPEVSATVTTTPAPKRSTVSKG